ncbi:hypothetical protein [Brachybacterium sacelli]
MTGILARTRERPNSVSCKEGSCGSRARRETRLVAALRGRSTRP